MAKYHFGLFVSSSVRLNEIHLVGRFDCLIVAKATNDALTTCPAVWRGANTHAHIHTGTGTETD